MSPSISRSLLIATGNQGKVREMKSILGDIPWAFHSLSEFPESGVAAEDGDSYLVNAIKKACYYALATGLHALADDSGLEVAALGGAPGLFSARYAGIGASDADRRERLLSELRDVSSEARAARFVCAVAIAAPDGELRIHAEGVCPGTIGWSPRGSSGFGYDPLFIPDGYQQTFAEMAESEKNLISHRARALAKLKEFLTQ